MKEKIFNIIKSNQIVCTILIIFIAGFLFFDQTVTGYMQWHGFLTLGLMILAFLGLLIYWRIKRSADNIYLIIQTIWGLIFICAVYALSVIRNYGLGSFSVSAFSILAAVWSIAAVITVVWAKARGKISAEQLIVMVMFAGILLRFAQVLFTTIYELQNDAGQLSDWHGHLAYIYYLFFYGHLPEFDPTTRLQFYHPPLHHAIAGEWLWINTNIGYTLERAGENIQLLTFAYSSGMLLVLDKIMKKLKAGVNARLCVVGIVAFFPYFIVQAGAVNNDTLVTLLMLLSIYYALKWYEKPTVKNILILAVMIGGAMMTKLSGGFVAVAVAFIFAAKLVRERRHIQEYIEQFALFACAVFPLGLWYPIRNRVKFGVPFNYVQKFSEELEQFIGKYNTVKERLFDFSLNQFNSLAVVWSNQSEDCDHNIFITMFKTAVFGEGSWFTTDAVANTIAGIAFWIVVLLMLTLTVLFVYWVIKSALPVEKRIFILISVVVIFALYIKFCFEYVFICTMNVRYVLIPLLLLIIGGCLGAERLLEKHKKHLKINPAWVVAVFDVVCVMLFTVYILIH